MADTNDTTAKDRDDDAPEKKGAGALGLAAAPVAAYTGALGISHIMDKPSERLTKKITDAATAHTVAQATYDAKVTGAIAGLTDEQKILYNAFNAAKEAHETAELSHFTKIAKEWEAALHTADAKKIEKIYLTMIEAELASIKGDIPPSVARDWLVNARTAALNAVKEAIKKPEFTGATGKDAFDFLEGASSNAYNAFEAQNPIPEGIDELLQKFAMKTYSATVDAMAKADPELAQTIANATKTEKDTLDAAKTAFTEAEGKWKPVLEAATKTEKSALDAAERTTQSLRGIEALNAEKGFMSALARPGKLLMRGNIVTKLVILGTGAAAALGTYMGVRAIRGHSQPDSFVERERQRDAARGAEPSPSVG